MRDPRTGSVSLTPMVGVRCVFRGVSFIVATRRAWPYALAPLGILVLLTAALGWINVTYVAPWAEGVIPEFDSLLGRIGARVAGAALLAFLIVLAFLVASLLTPLLSAPALEHVVKLAEQSCGVAPRRGQGFWAELSCGLRAQVTAAAIGLPTLALLWLVTLFFPPAVPVTVPIQYVVVTSMIAWNLLDYPLTLRGMPARERLALFRSHWPPVLGFGVGFAILFAIPCATLALLPAGVAGATFLLLELGVLRLLPPMTAESRAGDEASSIVRS